MSDNNKSHPPTKQSHVAKNLNTFVLYVRIVASVQYSFQFFMCSLRACIRSLYAHFFRRYVPARRSMTILLCAHKHNTAASCEIIHCAVAVDSRIKSSRACTRLVIYEMRRRERRGAFVWIQLGSQVVLWFHPRFLPAQLICQQCSCTRALTWGAGLTNSASTRMMLTFTDAKKSTGFLPRKSSNHDKA